MNKSLNSSRLTSLRSNFAQALESGFVELTNLRKSFGKLFFSSNLLKDSKGLVVITPPKSQNTAFIINFSH